MKENTVKRCEWCGNDPLYVAYHDEEWGVPVHDDQRMFEMLLLEGVQAGLSWITVLKKRDNYRAAFDNFDAEKIARYQPRKIETLLKNPGIIRNRLKVEAAVTNAQAFLALRDSGTTLCDFMWQFVEGKPIVNRWRNLKELPATTKESDTLSKALKKHGFKFVGSTIVYAHMQATGMVNDHVVSCFRYQEIKQLTHSK